MPVSRRTILRASAAGFLAGPSVLAASPASAAPLSTTAASTAAASTAAAFVDSYQTNTTANLTVDTNAAVRILSGFQTVWSTGTAWNTGTVLDEAFLRASMRGAITITSKRTQAEADKAFVVDRQHQSYSVIAGLGPLAALYRSGALAVTGITAAPATTPATTISDAVPADAPAGSAIGAGSTSSALGRVVTLVNTLRGNYSSGNPSKYAYQYPRPWRMTLANKVVDTGVLDEFGFPVYDSEVKVVPTLLRQRSTSPTDDAGFVSGHTNALFLASLSYAYAVPERFQELVATAYDLAHTRIVAGMHSPVDVIGGRILATALAAGILNDPANASVKADARAQALAYFQAQAGTSGVFDFAHSYVDEYGDRSANAANIRHKHTYDLPSHGKRVPFTVPKGAEVLLETRLPYLDAEQRREVLRTTGLASGHPILDSTEQWGRINLFAAADGFGAFDATVAVTLDAAQGGFAAKDTWKNDIDGRGGLVKLGSGELALSGDNDFRGGVTVAEGTLTAASRTALGGGDVTVSGGTLKLEAGGVKVRGGFRQSAGTLVASVDAEEKTPLTVDGEAVIGANVVLSIAAGKHCDPTIPVLKARSVRGRFAKVVVTTAGYRADLVYTGDSVAVRVRKG
ncbi:phosphatase PAP2 family protein [Actinoplanes sp. NPDC051851]|uniref:phosphatase PAP2 family protein n=1 Tax=Actinoplanes sp. NPDC051851 TaxID=3154753 RepID=UPI0034266FEA